VPPELADETEFYPSVAFATFMATLRVGVESPETVPRHVRDARYVDAHPTQTLHSEPAGKVQTE